MGEEEDFEASVLGTKDYWENIYQRDLVNFSEFSDIGEIWFGEDVEEKIIEWVKSHISTSDGTYILELGCGNGHLLVEMALLGYTGLFGVDYSPAAIDLCKKYAANNNLNDISFSQMDILDGERVLEHNHRYHLILDKGTFDAISLKPSESDSSLRRRDRSVVDKYCKNLKSLLDPQHGTFLITSCNWTENELIEIFESASLVPTDRINHPSFQFGGQKGQTVSSVIFKLIVD